MMTGVLSNLTQELSLYPQGLQQGFGFLQQADIMSLPLGKIQIAGDDVFAIVSEYETEPYEQRRPEAHVKYADIQYVASGCEMIVSAPLAAAGKVTEDALAERDLVFFADAGQETRLTLAAGMFAVYFPWDVHRPNCSPATGTEKVRKVVVKVAMKLLGNK